MASSLSATNNIEHRKEKRFPFHWAVAIVFDATEHQETYHGITYDLSMSGCSILTDHNVFSDAPVTILLSTPTDIPRGRKPLVEVKAKMVYTVLAAGLCQFRCGIHFLRFKDKGRSTLQKAIDKRILTSV